MREAGIGHLVLYGNAWQGDYLRYGADFGILEGHGIALVAADGAAELYLDSATEAERAEIEVPPRARHFAPDIARAVGARLDRVANERLAAAPRRFLPRWLADPARSFALERRHRAGRPAADAQERRRDRGGAPRRADRRRGLCRVPQGGPAGPPPVRDRRRYRSASARAAAVPDNFMIIGSGGKDVFGMTPPSERRIAAGDLVTTELTPAVEGYFAQICRTLVVGKASEAQRRAFAVFVEALEAGIAAVRPGVRAADVAQSRERRVPQTRPRRIHHQPMDARARPRHGPVRRFQAAYPRRRGHRAGAGHDADRASQHLSSRRRLHRARRRRAS